MIVANLIAADSFAAMQDSPPVILDCCFDLTAPAAGREAYLTAHIPGARYVDLNQDLAGPVTNSSGRHPLPAPDALARRLASLGIGRTSQVVVYDAANGSFAARAWWLLRWLGHQRVAVLDGGFAAWVARGGALESGEPHPPTSDAARSTDLCDATPREHAVATASEIREALQDPARRVIDARSAERFAGAAEPIDAVAGHIPGAINHPFTGNLLPDGRFLPTAELRRRWQERLGGVAPEGTIQMCGSGVTACHNLLALELAGLPGAKLYPGSWSEWIRDPERPVARGVSPLGGVPPGGSQPGGAPPGGSP